MSREDGLPVPAATEMQCPFCELLLWFVKRTAAGGQIWQHANPAEFDFNTKFEWCPNSGALFFLRDSDSPLVRLEPVI